MASNPLTGDDQVPFLSRAVNVSRSELPGLLSAAAWFFFLLCSYYIMRPVRDEMGVRGGVENMQWLFTATFFAMLVAETIFTALATRFRRTRLIPAVYGIFIACIALLWLWLRSDVQMVWAARGFFVWLSVFNLFVVSVFWSFPADVFSDRQATRLFGAIAAGGSAGAIGGPAISGVLAQQLEPASRPGDAVHGRAPVREVQVEELYRHGRLPRWRCHRRVDVYRTVRAGTRYQRYFDCRGPAGGALGRDRLSPRRIAADTSGYRGA